MPAWLNAPRRPSTWPLLSCVVRLMPSENWVCSMVCMPKLLTRIQGMTVTKLAGDADSPRPRPKKSMAPAVSYWIDTR